MKRENAQWRSRDEMGSKRKQRNSKNKKGPWHSMQLEEMARKRDDILYLSCLTITTFLHLTFSSLLLESPFFDIQQGKSVKKEMYRHNARIAAFDFPSSSTFGGPKSIFIYLPARYDMQPGNQTYWTCTIKYFYLHSKHNHREICKVYYFISLNFHHTFCS